MTKKVTVCIDVDLDKKLRLKQAKYIKDEQIAISYSRVLNETLRNSLKIPKGGKSTYNKY